MLIDGHYQVLKPLGEGFSGEVSLVEDEKTKSALALKFLQTTPGNLTPEQLLDRFKQEFSILQKLHYPHIARIESFGFDVTSKRHYFTEEFVDGQTIFDATENSTPNEIEELMVQTLRALQFLHSRGVYHFDLKPANLLVEKTTGQVKIIDFGLANLPGHIFAGTPTYMAPEVCLREPRDGRADLYALGIIWYQCLTRVNPFAAGNSQATIERQIKMEVPPISNARPDLPAYLDIILSRLLAKNPAHRYSKPASVIRDLNFMGQKSYPIETGATSIGYLPEEGEMIGREKEWRLIRELIEESSRGKATGNPPIILVSAAAGLGKTRLAHETRYLAQLSGCELAMYDYHRPLSSSELGQLRAESLHPNSNVKLVYIACYPQDAKSLEEWLPLDQTHLLELKPFRGEEIEKYLRQVTGADQIPLPLCDAIEARTEGNPRLLRELLTACFARHLFFDATGRWNGAAFDDLQTEIESLPLPTTIGEWFASRISKLPIEAIKVLKVLAVCRHPLPPWALERFAGARSSWATSLTQEGWIDWQEDYAMLRNPSVREWLLNQMSREERTKWHDQIASTPELCPNENQDYHLAFGSDPRKAVPALNHYTQKLAENEKWNQIAEAIGWVWPTLPVSSEKVSLGLKWINSLVELKRHGEVENTIQKVASVAEKLPAEERLIYELTLEEETIEWMLRGQAYQAARERIDKAIKANKELPIPNKIRLENYLGRISLEQGELKRAENLLKTTWEAASLLPANEKKRTFNNDLGLVYLLKGDYSAAASHFGEELKSLLPYHDAYLESRCYYNLGEAYRGLKEQKKANEYLRQSYTKAQKMGRYELTLRALNALGNLHNEAAESNEAIDCYERAMHLAERIGDRISTAAIATNLGILFHSTAKDADALSYLTHARHLLRHSPRTSIEDSCLARCLLELALLQEDRGDIPGAMSSLSEAEKIANAGLLPYIQEAKKEIGGENITESPSTPEEKGSGDTKTTVRPALPSFLSNSSWQYVLTLNQQLTQEKDFNSFIQTVINYVVELSKAEFGIIFLLEDEKKFVSKAAQNIEAEKIESQVSHTILERTLKLDKPLLIGDAQIDPSLKEQESVINARIRSVLCLPIHVEDKMVGCLYLSHSSHSSAFQTIDLSLMQAFADQVGIAMRIDVS